jgi:IS5 family transposase
VDKANPDIDIKHRGKFKSLTDEDKKDLKRRQAIEPIIGHLKADHRMNRCHLKWSRATVTVLNGVFWQKRVLAQESIQ